MIERWVAVSAAYLASARARESLAADPYWPKWDSPWWHMTLLWELGRADAIPPEAAEAMLAAIETKYLRFFPNPREPLPRDKDPHRDALCHCAVGTMIQVLEASGLDLETRAPWLRAWLLHYQLPDGGLNCDEAAYASGGSSSVQSTIAALEAVLACPRKLTVHEEAFLDRGAAWLIERRLTKRRRDGAPMKADFERVVFPRFYGYDLLRGLDFLAGWTRRRRAAAPRAAAAEALEALARRFPDGRARVERDDLPDALTLAREESGVWVKGRPVSTFPLLDAVRRVGTEIPVLTAAWARAREVLSS